MGAFERAAMSPKMALLTWQAVTRLPDLRAVAETIGVPTLVLHRRDEAMPVEMGREAAAAIPGARYVELQGVGSTQHAAEMGDHRWRDVLERHDDIARSEITSYKGVFVKHTGDGLLATFDGPTRAVLCATALAERMPQIGIDIRGGLHTGECIRRGDDIGGIAVHIAARIAAKAGARDVLVSDDRGEHVLRGVPGDWHLYAPVGHQDPVEVALAAVDAV